MALPANALTTVAAVCGELSISAPASGSADEADLERRIAAASDAIESHCARKFGKWTGTEKVPGHGVDCLLLSRTPLLSISAVTLDGEAVDASEYDATPEEQDAAAGLLRRSADADAPCWEWTARYRPGSASMEAGTERRAYAVTYSAGYVLPKDDAPGTPRTLPYDVEHACLLTVVADYRSKGRDQNIISESVMEASVTYAGSTTNSAIGRGAGGIIPDNAVALLQRYRRDT